MPNGANYNLSTEDFIGLLSWVILDLTFLVCNRIVQGRVMKYDRFRIIYFKSYTLNIDGRDRYLVPH